MDKSLPIIDTFNLALGPVSDKSQSGDKEALHSPVVGDGVSQERPLNMGIGAKVKY